MISAIMASIACWTAQATIPDLDGVVELDVTRSDFPADFTFGVATSAAQVRRRRPCSIDMHAWLIYYINSINYIFPC